MSHHIIVHLTVVTQAYVGGLSDMYIQSPRSKGEHIRHATSAKVYGPRAKGRHIRQTTYAHVTTVMLHILGQQRYK